MNLSTAQLLEFLPALVGPKRWAAVLDSACHRFGITTKPRLSAFLAQIAHESSGFTRLTENLNYSAERLMRVWPRRFPTVDTAEPYAHQPEKLANRVYADRGGNGNEASGDGWRYRGRGLIQLTFRGNYREIGMFLDLPLEDEPDTVAAPDRAALVAGQFWAREGLNSLADVGTTAAFDDISRRINGGNQGLVERRALWARAKAVLA